MIKQKNQTYLVIALIIVFCLVFAVMGSNERDLFGPINAFILDTSQNNIILHCYQPSSLMRIVRVVPLDWYLVNEHNVVFFLLDNGVGRSCSMFYSPAITYRSWKVLDKEIPTLECITPSLSQISDLITRFAFEKIDYIPPESPGTKSELAELIDFLITAGIFTFHGQEIHNK